MKGATLMTVLCRSVYVFQSTHPVKGATTLFELEAFGVSISIHAPREGCDIPSVYSIGVINISIHAPREGCDAKRADKQQDPEISIHAPREGCDAFH